MSTLQIQENASLKHLNTFGVDAMAALLGEFKHEQEAMTLLELARERGIQPLVLGGGSNVLFTNNVDRLVMLNRIGGISLESSTNGERLLRIGAGEVWHDVVMHCVEQGWGGIENLSLIPGRVGAAPMQNIGAYGVELKDVFVDLQALHIPTQELHTFDTGACVFGYRDSFFKQEGKDEYVILNVRLRLTNDPILNTSYGTIQDELHRMRVTSPTIRDVSQAVINIRRSKLPDPAVVGNAGSFFKNPVVAMSHYENILKNNPNVVAYPAEGGLMKLAAGWLIEQAGWKGYRDEATGAFGVHDRQALVLVNHGNAKGASIHALSERIQRSIEERFGVILEREVNII